MATITRTVATRKDASDVIHHLYDEDKSSTLACFGNTMSLSGALISAVAQQEGGQWTVTVTSGYYTTAQELHDTHMPAVRG